MDKEFNYQYVSRQAGLIRTSSSGPPQLPGGLLSETWMISQIVNVCKHEGSRARHNSSKKYSTGARTISCEIVSIKSSAILAVLH